VNNLLIIALLLSLLPQETKPIASLSIEADLVLQSGEVVPVARQKLYLLDRHPGKILREAGIPLGKEHEKDGDDGYLKQLQKSYYAMTIYSSVSIAPTDAERERVASAIKQMDALFSKAVKETTTDFGGKASFNDLVPGNYWLVARVPRQRGIAVWITPVEIKSGSNQFVMDNSNALAIR